MNNSYNECLLLYAPNVHTGGGLTLLNSLMKEWPHNLPLIAWLDIRAKDKLLIPKDICIKWVDTKFRSRLEAELSLFKAGNKKSRVLCFHGLPPLLKNRAKIYLFQQNRILISRVDLRPFLWRVKARIRIEQLISWYLRFRVDAYWVQTYSMAVALQSWFGSEKINIHILPFMPTRQKVVHKVLLNWDFIYVADGAGHKNHRKLVEAWIILATQGLRPSLALTLTARDYSLKQWIESQINIHDLRIADLGELTHENVLDLYYQAKALIFPSKSESYGLPLVEAKQANLPIIASELDFVRDVCLPSQTFDPDSSLSIARAVKRFLGENSSLIEPVSAKLFIEAVMK